MFFYSCLLVFAQTHLLKNQTLDIISYTPPLGWDKEVKTSVTSYTIVNKQKKHLVN